MDAPDLQEIYHYRDLSPDLAGSGQPSADQLKAIAAHGFEVVINLAMPDDTRALPDEQRIVETLGMVYEPIPVVWAAPTPGDLTAFLAAMDRHAGRKVWVHCVANFRASAFVMLYRVLRLDWSLAAALPDLQAIWQPNPTWQAFIDQALAGGR